eukprot:9050054-Pyramimonas_sp.AAC.1
MLPKCLYLETKLTACRYLDESTELGGQRKRSLRAETDPGPRMSTRAAVLPGPKLSRNPLSIMA